MDMMGQSFKLRHRENNGAARNKEGKGIFCSEPNPRVFCSYVLGSEGGVGKRNGRKGQEKENICKVGRWHILESSRKGGLKLPK